MTPPARQCFPPRYLPQQIDLAEMSDYEIEQLVRKFQGDLMDAAESIQVDLRAFRARWEVMRGYRKKISSEHAPLKEMTMLPDEMSPAANPPMLHARVTSPDAIVRRGRKSSKSSKIWSAPAEEVIAAYNRLQSTRKVAEEYGCSWWVARYRLKGLGVKFVRVRTEAHNVAIAKGVHMRLAGGDAKVVKEKTRIHTASREEVLDAYHRLGTAVAVAREFNTFPNTASVRLKKEGIDVSKNRGIPGGAKNDLFWDDNEVRAVYARLKTSAATATEFKVSPSTMKRRLNNLGICLRANSGLHRKK